MRIIEAVMTAAAKRAEPLDISRNTVSGFMAVFYGGGGGLSVFQLSGRIDSIPRGRPPSRSGWVRL